MRILSIKPGHDGAFAYLENGVLQYSYEGEKDSHDRYEQITPESLIDAARDLPDIPDVFAVSGWMKGSGGRGISEVGQGYHGLDAVQCEPSQLFGRPVQLFSSSHERSHLFCAYGMSPFEKGRPVYALIWEGGLGNFYEIDSDLNISLVGKVMNQPGGKYSAFYWIASAFEDESRHGNAGKLMALASFSRREKPNADEQQLLDFILNYDQKNIWRLQKGEMEWSRFLGIGVASDDFKQLAGKVSDAIFDQFYKFAKENLQPGRPLIVAGGCGLNCEWNTRWLESGWFDGVFVPPCANDTGSAIGTAIDAQFTLTGQAKIEWNVYSGTKFVHDQPVDGPFEEVPLDYSRLAQRLQEGKVFAWVQGRCEIGPRALCHRSIIAAPFERGMQDRLNRIKQRESFRPIAPVCLAEDVGQHFEWRGSSPYMLFFQKVLSPQLGAVTHVDDTARIQTVSPMQNARMHQLLTAFKERTGFGVLCNTSLNYKGRGFINCTSDLVNFCVTKELDGFVVDDRMYLPVDAAMSC